MAGLLPATQRLGCICKVIWYKLGSVKGKGILLFLLLWRGEEKVSEEIVKSAAGDS